MHLAALHPRHGLSGDPLLHSTKFAARLQEATASDRPIWFYMERSVGHGAGTRLSDLVRRYDRAYAFMEDALGVD